MAKATTTVVPKSRTIHIRPLFSFACGVALMLGGALVYWLEPGPTARPVVASDHERAELASARALHRAREREAQARAELERQAAEEAAERRRRAMVEADAASEAAARRQREELAERRAEAERAQRASDESEDAWKRFYRPSANCRDAASTATVECVNEYVKAKREFQSRAVARTN